MSCQNKFRHLVQDRDKKCLVTGLCGYECDAAHIIPYNICHEYSLQFIYDRRNGIFLSKNIHALFDRFYWTFDIYDVIWSPISNKYSCRIIVVPNHKHKHLTINQYKDQYIEIPIEIIPFLYTHYQLFIIYNYTRNAKKLMEQDYREIIQDDKVFNYLVTHELPIDAFLNKTFRQFLIDNGIISVVDQEHDVNAIIKHTLYADTSYYLIWWDHIPRNDATFEPLENISSRMVIEYHQRVESIKDLDYS